MATENSRPPWGDAFAIKPAREVEEGKEKGKDIWVPLGPVWKSETGALTLTLDAMPVHWDADAGAERRIVIKPRAQQNTGGDRARR